MEIVFLGTGNAFGSGGRHSISILVRHQEVGVLLDCGPSTLPTMKKLGLSTLSVDLVLVSHLHGDHFGGVPFLLLDYQYQTPRDKPLTVAGPSGTEERLRILSSVLFLGLESKARSYDLQHLALDDRGPVELGGFDVLPFRVRHLEDGIALGYRLQAGGQTIVYSGDTEWTDELGRQSRGADLFICECSSFETKTPYHMSHLELAAHRGRIGARRTLLVHAGDDVLARRSELVFELAEDEQKVKLW